VDGSLRRRFKGIPGAERLHAKTGSLAHVAALSGYLQSKSGRWVAFSLMANAEANDLRDVQNVFDRICALFLEQEAE
jgi:D-alanyl-D-alanine carboxypeptidase/D-alanyl-D-alanine-endopeptidase (penicillin-binding protein 4)